MRERAMKSERDPPRAGDVVEHDHHRDGAPAERPRYERAQGAEVDDPKPDARRKSPRIEGMRDSQFHHPGTCAYARQTPGYAGSILGTILSRRCKATTRLRRGDARVGNPAMFI